MYVFSENLKACWRLNLNTTCGCGVYGERLPLCTIVPAWQTLLTGVRHIYINF